MTHHTPFQTPTTGRTMTAALSNSRATRLAFATAFLWLAASLLSLMPANSRAQAPTVLSLYGVALQGLSASEFTQAAEKAGVKPLRDESKGSVRVFDARPAGVPGLGRMSLVVSGDGLMALVQFDVNRHEGEALRQLLRAKYGNPHKADGRFSCQPKEFDAAFVADCRYTWTFGGSMELVYNQEFATTTLSYVDRRRLAAVHSRAQNDVAELVRDRAKTLNDRF